MVLLHEVFPVQENLEETKPFPLVGFIRLVDENKRRKWQSVDRTAALTGGARRKIFVLALTPPVGSKCEEIKEYRLTQRTVDVLKRNTAMEKYRTSLCESVQILVFNFL